MGSIRMLEAGGGRLSWSVQGDEIAYDKADAEGEYDLWVMTADGDDERCITCERYDFHGRNVLDPAWHPSGDLIAVEVQDPPRRMRQGIDAETLAGPDRGLYGEIWLVHRNGRDGWQLTQVRERGGAVLGPHFSFEGDRLLWSERVATDPEPFGEWVVRVARFQERRGVPRLSRVETLRPKDAPGLLLASSFAADDRGVLVAGTVDGSTSERGREIFRLEAGGPPPRRLTRSSRAADQGAVPVPGSGRLAWISDVGLLPVENPRGGSGLRWISEVWWMEADGSDQQRLTGFNDPTADEFLGVARVSDLDVSPDGRALAAHVVYQRQQLAEAIFLIELGTDAVAAGRIPVAGAPAEREPVASSPEPKR